MFPYFITFTVITLIGVGFVAYVSSHNFNFSFDKMNVLAPPIIVLTASMILGGGNLALTSSLSIKNQLTYNEMWNGFETEATKKSIKCYKDGSCVNTYSCDPEQKVVTKFRTVSDGKGGTRTEPYTEIETVWHSCPYSKQETSYYVQTNLPNTTVSYGRNLMTGEQYRRGTSIPGGQQTDPAAWIEAKNRIDSGKPEGLTEKHTYENFIHATDNTYKKDKTLVENYLSQGLLPSIQTGINSGRNSKFYPVNYTGINSDYNLDVANLNGVMAAEKKHGDLRVVMINSESVDNQYDYTNALAAYWSSSEYFGKWALPKNALTVVIAVDPATSKVTWADAFTGMPIGNEAFMQSVKSLAGKNANEKLIGRPYLLKDKTIVRGEGELEKLIWSDTSGFQRVSMSGDDNEANGFTYLLSDIEPTKGAKITASVIWSIILGLSILFAFMVMKSNASNFRIYNNPSKLND